MCSCGENRFAQKRGGLWVGRRRGTGGGTEHKRSEAQRSQVFYDVLWPATATGKQQKAERVLEDVLLF